MTNLTTQHKGFLAMALAVIGAIAAIIGVMAYFNWRRTVEAK